MIDLIPFFVVIIYGEVGLGIPPFLISSILFDSRFAFKVLDRIEVLQFRTNNINPLIVIRLDSQGCRVAVTIFSSTLASLLVVKLSQHSGS